MAFPVEIGAALATGGLSAIGSLGSALLSQGYNEKNMALQSKFAKDLMDYQWQNYSSPKALLNAYTAAGVNPTSVFGHGNGGVSSPSVNMPSSAPVSVPNVLDLSALSSYIKSVADAKKAGMDTKLSEQEIKNKEVQRQSDQFELDLKKQFGSEFKSVELAQAYRNLLLSSDSHDINVQEKALNEWKIATEKAVSDIKESEREIMKQTLDNNPNVIRLDNALREAKIESEKAGQVASYASAAASRSQADVNRENRRLQAALADIEEKGKISKIESLISEYEKNKWISEAEANEARIKASRLHSVEVRRDNSILFKEIDDLSEWIKSKVKIFH